MPISAKKSSIGWNGLQLECPRNWEPIVSDLNHLIFEEDFEPVLQLRWKKVTPLKKGDWAKKSEEWWHKSGLNNKESAIPEPLKSITENYSHSRYFKGKSAMESGGVCYCNDCHTLLIFQLLNKSPKTLQQSGELLSTLRCHGSLETVWKIQDFSLRAPQDAKLTDYSFKAGLTRLSFNCGDYSLQVCRLAQARDRLLSQSLERLLKTLAGTTELDVHSSDDLVQCNTSRSPGIMKQILLRMKKEKPFIEARLWQLPEHDRLLGAFAFSKKPIPRDGIQAFYETLQIVSA